ncbi:MAG: tyrosine--tRNA ligase [Armatimonadetes bacterium]|nr:tyrosine--tRNA ligase [Armatimonadota bacterium]
MTIDEQLELLSRGCSEVIRREDLARKLKSSAETGEPLRVKLGVDPTVPAVTLGWAVVLRKLRDFQRLGHTACLIIGDFTAMIGDPSGASKTRPQLSREEVQANVKQVEAQLYKILDPEKTEITYNADWLGKMEFADVIMLAGHTTVARIMERDDFQKRFHPPKIAQEGGQTSTLGFPLKDPGESKTKSYPPTHLIPMGFSGPDPRALGLHEILYPLCQGYDSVKIRADIELGGNDQKFNNLIGRQLQGHYGQEPQVVMLMPLLIGLDGKEKMSQSMGNFIGVTEEPNEIFGKTMAIPDDLIESWFTLCTDVPQDEISRMDADMKEGRLNPRDAKMRLAKEIVGEYHGEPAAKEAGDYFVRTFSKRETPEEAPDATIPATAIQDGKVLIARLITDIGLTKSAGEARRIMKGGGVRIGGRKFTDPFATISLQEADGQVLRVGRHRFRRLRA